MKYNLVNAKSGTLCVGAFKTQITKQFTMESKGQNLVLFNIVGFTEGGITISNPAMGAITQTIPLAEVVKVKVAETGAVLQAEHYYPIVKETLIQQVSGDETTAVVFDVNGNELHPDGVRIVKGKITALLCGDTEYNPAEWFFRDVISFSGT